VYSNILILLGKLHIDTQLSYPAVS